jgi:hypothetical protein
LVIKCKNDVSECYYVLMFLLTTSKINHVIPQDVMRLIQKYIRFGWFAAEWYHICLNVACIMLNIVICTSDIWEVYIHINKPLK